MDGKTIITVPNIITLGRLLLGIIAAYLLVAGHVTLALGIFAVAWALDVIDGWVARHFNQATSFGYLFDKIVDRALLIGAVVFLLRSGEVPPITVLIFTRDIVALPALAVQIIHRKQIADLGMAGKVLTLLQGVALLWIAVVGSYGMPISLILAAIGTVVGGQYVYRVVYLK